MRLLAVSTILDTIVEIGVVKVPRGIGRDLKVENSTTMEARLEVAHTAYFLASQFDVSVRGTALYFTYKGPAISPDALEGSLLTLVVPKAFSGFVHTKYE